MVFVVLVLILTGCKKDSVDPKPEIEIPISDNSDIKKIDGGLYHSMLLKKDGSLWATGENGFGQLGTGDNSYRPSFTEVLTNVKDVACGQNHTLALKNDGSLWVAGYNQSGQLGTSDNSDRNNFESVLENIIAIDAGQNHSVVISKDSILLVCGRNSNGQLGISNKLDINEFRQVMEAKTVAASPNGSFIISDGNLYAAGFNLYGQLGAFNYEEQTIFKKVTTGIDKVCGGFTYTMAMTESGLFMVSGLEDYESRSESKGVSNITEKSDLEIRDMSAGLYHYLVVSDSVLYGVGLNDMGQLGISEYNTSDFVKIAENVSRAFTGYYSSWYIDTDGELWATGSNSHGELGTGGTTSKTKFEKIDF